MANFFPRWTNWLPLKVVVIGAVLGTAVTAGMWYYFTPKYTRVGYQPVQPIPFSHEIHATELGMDCRYCHSLRGCLLPLECAEHAGLHELPLAGAEG